MKRVILDTNIYGVISKEKNMEKMLEAIQNLNDTAFYGIREVIRKEIRDTPRNVSVLGNKSLRMLLLKLYDTIIQDHELRLNEKINFIAERYYYTYKEFGGGISKKDILKDFLIISCASVNNLDIVVSEDNHTMLSVNSIKSYKLINKTLKLRTPELISYNKFKRWFSL